MDITISPDHMRITLGRAYQARSSNPAYAKQETFAPALCDICTFPQPQSRSNIVKHTSPWRRMIADL